MSQHIVLDPEDACPLCGKLLNAAAVVSGEEEAPRAGDYTVCTGCASILCFGEDLRLRTLTASKWFALIADGEAWAALQRLQAEIVEGVWERRWE